jgi:alpha-ribazole phosphatase
MLSRIYLIRHGRTDGNRNHWYYGATDLPLTEDGTEELRAYAAQNIYPDIPADAQFFTTGLIRTDQTLEAIYGTHKHSAIPKLQEINFGKAECMTYDELKVFDNFDKWAWDTTGNERIADAETANEFHDRIGEGLKELLEKHRKAEQAHEDDGQDAVTVVVCHGGVIACIMEKLFPAVCGSMWDWLPEPGFGYAVDFQGGEPYMYSKINDIGRLGLGLYRLPLRNLSRMPKNDLFAGPKAGKERTRQTKAPHLALSRYLNIDLFSYI